MAKIGENMIYKANKIDNDITVNSILKYSTTAAIAI